MRSLWENVAFFAIFYILYKRTQHSFRSFWFHKNNIKEWCILKVVLFAIYIYISIYIYIYIYISIYQYIYIYIYWKKEWGLGMRSLQMNAAFFVFLCVLWKWTLRSLRSFAFFANERCILCYVLKKRTQKNALFFWGLITRQKLSRQKLKKKNAKACCIL